MAYKYFLNLNYVCNERCIFCAADLANNKKVHGRWPALTLADVREWSGDEPPGPDDQVLLAGGEPTLRQELLPIVRFLSTHCRDVTIFTNGLRFADPLFAHSVLEAGVTRVEIALFGATPERHEAITRVRGSFEQTLVALNTLAALKAERAVAIELRLLVSRQTAAENPAIVRLVRERAPGIDAVSLNRLILSQDATRVDATISWEEARAPVNEAARLVRESSYQLVFGGIPFCVFDGDNARFVREEIAHYRERVRAGLIPGRRRMRYLDPFEREGQVFEHSTMGQSVLTAPCLACDYFAACERVEDWYVERYGTAGIRSLHREPAPLAGAGTAAG